MAAAAAAAAAGPADGAAADTNTAAGVHGAQARGSARALLAPLSKPEGLALLRTLPEAGERAAHEERLSQLRRRSTASPGGMLQPVRRSSQVSKLAAGATRAQGADDDDAIAHLKRTSEMIEEFDRMRSDKLHAAPRLARGALSH